MRYNSISKVLLCLTLLAALFTSSFAWSAGIAAYHEVYTLYSGATGTTAEVNSTAKVFQYPVKTYGCTISSSPSTTVLFRLEGTTDHVVSWATNSTSLALITQTTCTNFPCYVSTTDKPATTIRTVTTTPSSTTSTVTEVCAGMQ